MLLSNLGYLSLIGVILIDFLIYRAVFYPLFFDFIRLTQLVRKGNFTQGVIVDFRKKEDFDQKDQFAPVVKFTSANGSECLVESNDYKYTKPAINTIVDVCYENEDPSSAIISPSSLLTFKAFLMIVVVLVVAVINIGIFIQIF